MGYTKRWVPPSVAIPNNLTAWKLICQDIHDQLLNCGLYSSADSGQLDISTVASLPLRTTFAGYKIYVMDDGVTTPVYIKLEFGVNETGLGSNPGSGYYVVNNTLRIKVTIGLTSDGAGTITGNVVTYQCPQEYTPPTVGSSSGGTPTNNGKSFACYNEDRGFFGFAYQIGGRDEQLNSDGYGRYSGSTLVIFIQRDLDNDGIAILAPYIASATNFRSGKYDNWGINEISRSYYLSTSGLSQPSYQWARSTMNAPISMSTFMDFPYVHNNSGMIEIDCLGVAKFLAATAGDQVTVNVGPGVTQNMIALGHETSITIGPAPYNQHCLFMLFE